MSPGLICVTHFSRPLAASMAMTAQAYLVSSRWSSFVGRRGALLVSVPKKIVFVAASNDGVPQTVLVAGPKWKTCSPQLSLIVTGGSSGSGFGPTSYFHTTLPDCGSSATTKPRPVQPLYDLLCAYHCSNAPPANTILSSARMGEAKVPLSGCASGKSLARVSTFHFSLPVFRSRAYRKPARSAK